MMITIIVTTQKPQELIKENKALEERARHLEEELYKIRRKNIIAIVEDLHKDKPPEETQRVTNRSLDFLDDVVSWERRCKELAMEDE